MNMSPQQLEKTIEKLLRALDLQAADETAYQDLREELLKALSHLKLDTNPRLQDLQELARDSSKGDLLRGIHKYLAESGGSLKDDQIPIITGDGFRQSDPYLKARASQIVVILDNLRSVFNVGSIFRSSECLALGEIAICGITPGPDHPNFAKTAMDTQDKIPYKAFKNTADAINHYKERNYLVYALETAESAVCVFEEKLEPPLAIVLGNESLGLSQDTLALCDGILALPVLGWKNSLNVGVAFAVCAYQLVFGGLASTHQA